MKKLLILALFVIGLILPANANILPNSTKYLSNSTIGMYQIPKHFVVYAKPDDKSKILYEASWDYKSFKASNGDEYNLFAVLIPQKELAFVQAVDFTEDWVQIIYNQNSNKTGWIKSEEFRFMLLRNFYNLYGRKYGLYLFNDINKNIKELHSATSDESQIVGSLINPQQIKLTAIKGNWALVTALDSGNVGKTGYIKWRNESGEIYLFPAIK